MSLLAGNIKHNNMETIIGLLFILLPVIFKLIGKRLEQSGNPDGARKVREFAEAVDGEESPMHSWEYLGDAVAGEQEEVTPAPVVTPRAETPVQEGTPVVTRKPILVEEDDKPKGEKIDPKKLVIYSEIMKPKF